MEIRALGAFGAEVVGLDTAHAVGDVEKRALRSALLRFGLLVVRGEILAPEQQVRFSRTFGELETFPWAPTQLQEQPEVFRISNDPDHGFENVGMYWHSDGRLLG